MLCIGFDILKSLIDAGEQAYPEEACALLVGHAGPGCNAWVSQAHLARNVASERRRRFEVDPGLRIGLERELRGTAESVLGVWHSHPDAPAAPSATDLAMAFEPHLVWLITALAGPQAVQTQAYFVNDRGDGFRPIPLKTI